MKKIIKVGFILSVILLIISISINIYATADNTNIPSAKSEITVNGREENQIEVIVTVKDLINAGDGVNAYTGILKFNSNELEFVEFISVDSWNNPTNKILDNEIKIVSTSNKFLKEDTIICKAIFNKKIDKDTYDVQISNLQLAAKVDNSTIKIIADAESTEEIEPVKTKNLPMIIIVCLIIVIVITIIYIISKKVKGEK